MNFYMRSFLTSMLFILLFIAFIDCSNSKEPNKQTDPSDQHELLIADFEKGYDPTNLGGKVDSWDRDGKPKVTISYNKNDGAKGSGCSIQVTLEGNDGSNGWTGGGLVLVLSNKSKGLDLSAYDTLSFDIKVKDGSQLSQTKVKLEDTEGNKRAERMITDYKINLKNIWQTVKIPLNEFVSLKNGDPNHWKELKISQVTKFVTVSVKDQSTDNGDGTLLIDNVKFLK